MSRIDRFIQTIQKFRAERLVLASGEKILLSIGNQKRPVSSKAATTQQVQDFLREIVPKDLEPEVMNGGNHEFFYNSPSGSVKVQVVRNNGSLQFQVVPVPKGTETRNSPSPASSEGRKDSGIQSLFRAMVQNDCSDLHLTTGNPPLFRKDGEIMTIGKMAALADGQLRNLLQTITPKRNWEEFQKIHDTDFSYEIPGVARFRCNLFLDRLGMGGVFRQIPSKIPTVEELGLSPHILALCHLTKGLVVVTGPTGSGKSTTLAAMINYINQNRLAHIITIEDPIEFVYPQGKCLINQREVGVHTRDFKTSLRAALREDPDIVLVGEMRDLETVATALETAETGHLVFATLHTNTAPSTVDRIIDQFPADEQSQVRTMLAESLKAVIAQTLCKRKDGGRVAAQEILMVNSAVSNLIREKKTYQIPTIMQTGRGIGMLTMNDSLLDLIQKNLVDPQEAYTKAHSKSEFQAILERNGIRLEGKMVTPATAPSTSKAASRTVTRPGN